MAKDRNARFVAMLLLCKNTQRQKTQKQNLHRHRRHWSALHRLALFVEKHALLLRHVVFRLIWRLDVAGIGNMQHDALQVGLVVAALVAALRRLVEIVGAERDDLGVQPGLERVDVARGKRISRYCRGRNVLRKVFRVQGGRGVGHGRWVELGGLACARRHRGGRFFGFFLAHGGGWRMCVARWTFGWALLF